jgi:hypothetical protein
MTTVFALFVDHAITEPPTALAKRREILHFFFPWAVTSSTLISHRE